MVAGISWENSGLAGAFVLGAIAATIGTIRVVRAVTVMLREEIRKEDKQ